MRQTVTCVVCGKPAEVYSGHVAARGYGYEGILAGWCTNHITHEGETSIELDHDGFAGWWEHWMGAEERPSSE